MRALTVIMLIIALNSGNAQSGLSAQVVTPKNVYMYSEPINVMLKIKNEDTKLIELKFHEMCHYLVLKNEKQILKCNWDSSLENIITLFPGDSFITMFNVALLFGKIYFIKEDDFFGLPIGSYTLQFKYEKGSISIQSNIITFHIQPPSPEESEAFELFNKGWRVQADRKYLRDAYRKIFSEIIEKYPSSVYAPAALLKTVDYDKEGDKISVYTKLLKNYPDDYSCWFAISTLFYDFRSREDKPGAEQFLQELITKHPNSFAAKEAQRRLVEIQPLTLEEWLNPELKRERRLKEYRQQHPER